VGYNYIKADNYLVTCE